MRIGYKTVFFSLLFIPLVFIVACSGPDEQDDRVHFVEHVRSTYLTGIAHFEGRIAGLHAAAYRFDSSERTMSELKENFFLARDSYKQIESLVEYYSPVTADVLNGPALSEIAEDDPNEIEILPEGFQVIEATLFADEVPDREELLQRVKVMKASVPRLRAMASSIEPSQEQLIDALKLEIARIASLGISGFDSPEAENSVNEARSALEGVLAFSQLLDSSTDVNLSIKAAIAVLQQPADFNSFDRLTFTRDHLNRISQDLHAAGSRERLASLDSKRLYRPSAVSLFSPGAFNELSFAPARASTERTKEIELGRMLFFDPVLSIDGDRACVSCHLPEKGFSDGLKASQAIGGSTLKRNAPGLLNVAFQSGNFWDSRVTFLEDQVKEVVLNKDEMHGSFEHAVIELKKSDEYRNAFRAAFGGEEISEESIRLSIASYLRSLTSLNSRFDRYMRGEDKILSDKEKLGYNVFMGKGKCGTCHFTPLFNGTVPPGYSKTEVEVLGVPSTPDTLRPMLDTDLGRFIVHGNRLHKNAFKTPTVRNIELTAPYMHNGVFATLEEVIEFYDRGGGAGLGLEVETQTLSPSKLEFTEEEEEALLAFMRSLTDTTGVVSRPRSVKQPVVKAASIKY